MTLFIILDAADHVIAHRHTEEEARRFVRHVQGQEPDKSFLLLHVQTGELIKHETIKPEVT